jgi:hypothetical protein
VIVLDHYDYEVLFGETLHLDGSSSYDPDGTIAEAVWKHGTRTIGEGLILDLTPKLGYSTIRFILTDNDGASSEAEILIKCDSEPEPTTAPPTEPPTVTQEPPSTVHQMSGIMTVAVLQCPAHLHAYDSEGNHIGLTEEGTVEYGIGNASYTGFLSSPEIITLFDAGPGIRFEVVPYEAGTFSLTLSSFGEGNQTQYVYDDITMNVGDVFVFETLYQGKLDADGNGEFDTYFDGTVLFSEQEPCECPEPEPCEEVVCNSDEMPSLFLVGLAALIVILIGIIAVISRRK